MKVENKELIDKILYYAANSKDNFISDEDAISPNLAGMKKTERNQMCLTNLAFHKDAVWNGFTQE